MFRIWNVLAVFVLAVAVPTYAQQFPNRSVKITVGFAAGSGPDIQARTVAQQLSISLGQTVYVENKVGANGMIAARALTQANPDGYNILFSSSSITPSPYIYKSLGFDMFTDLKPIATAGVLDGLLMLVDAKSPIKNVTELIALAKKQPLMYGSPGVGNILHLAAEMFSQKAGISMDHIPYKGASEVMAGLLGGSVQVMFVTPPSVMSLIGDGRVRPLAFTGSKRFAPLPDVPLLKDVLPGYEPMGSWGMFFAPGKTPVGIVERLNTAIRESLQVPEVASIMQRDGYFPDNRNANATAEFFRSELKRMKDAVIAAKIDPV